MDFVFRTGPFRFEMDGFQTSPPENITLTRVNTDCQDIEETRGPSCSRVKGQEELETCPRQQNSLRDQHKDDVDLFMQSIALQVKKMPPQMVARAKLNILTTVHDLQFETSSCAENLHVNDVNEPI